MTAPAPPRLGRWLLGLCRLGPRRPEIERDLQELFHARVAARGPGYARRRYLGDVASFYRHRVTRDGIYVRQGGQTVFDALTYDIRHAIRTLRHARTFFAVATVILALGFGANVAVFAVVDRLLLGAPPHIVDADRVVRLHIDVADIGGTGRFTWYQMPYLAYQGIREQARAFTTMAAYRQSQGSLGTGTEARPVVTVFADGHYFGLLGVQPVLGRLFGTADDTPPTAASVLVLSHALWQSAFGGDPAIVGKEVRLGARSYTVIGVAPRGFTGDTFEAVDVWLPLHAVSAEMTATWTTSRVNRTLSVLGRLADGVPRERAAEDVGGAYRRISEGTPVADPTARAYAAPLTPGRTTSGELTREGRVAIWLEVVSVLVLVVAVANVLNLQLTRAAARRRDAAVRVALGVRRSRLFAQLVMEMGLMAGIAGVIAVAVARWTAGGLQRLLTPAAGALELNGRVLAVAAVAIVLAALVCGGAAAVHAWAPHVAEQLRSGRGESRGRSRVRQGLLVLQVGTSLVLLVGAGLFVRSMARMNALQFGMDPEHVLAVTIPLRHAGYSPAAVDAFYDRALPAIAALPAVRYVTAGQTTPFSPSLSAPVSIPGFERSPFDSSNRPTYYAVTPSHFDTLGTRILRGRGFTDRDVAGAPPVMIVEQALASHVWPGQDPIGKCIRLGDATAPCREIVGVAANTRRFVAMATGALRYYIPLGQRLAQLPPQALLVRPSGDPVAAIPAVREALQRLDPGLPYANIRVLNDLAEPERRPWRLGSTLLTVFGAIALVVAATGVYGLLSALVLQRTREMGIRIALGASPATLVRLVVSQSLVWVAGGLGIGTIVAIAARRAIEPLLFETRAFDPIVIVAAPLVLLLAALVASAVPAWRAARVDPNVALRTE